MFEKFQILIIFDKCFILHAWLGFECACDFPYFIPFLFFVICLAKYI